MPPLPYIHIDSHKTSAVRKLQKPLKALNTDGSFVTFDTNLKRTKEQDAMIRVVKKLGLVDASPVNSQGPLRKTKKADRAHAISQDAPLATTPPRAKAPSVGHSTLSVRSSGWDWDCSDCCGALQPGGGGACRDHPPAHPRHSAPHAPSLEHPPAFYPPALSVVGAAESLPDGYAAYHPRATVTPGAPPPVHPFEYPALPSYEPILPLPYQFSTQTQRETQSAHTEAAQSLARYHDSRHRHRDRAAARTRNDPYSRFGAPIQDQDGQYRSPHAIALDDNSRHRRVAGDVLPMHDFRLSDDNWRAHHDHSMPPVAVHGSVDRKRNSRHSLTEDTRRAASATSSFGIQEDEARFAATYSPVFPHSGQRTPVGIEYNFSRDQSYVGIAHSDTMLSYASLPPAESPGMPVNALNEFHVGTVINAGPAHVSTEPPAFPLAEHQHQLGTITHAGFPLSLTQQVWSPVVPDTSYAIANFRPFGNNAGKESFQQQWHVPGHAPASDVLPSERVGCENLYSRDARGYYPAAPHAAEHETGFLEDLVPHPIPGQPERQLREYTFAAPHNHRGAYGRIPYNAILVQVPAAAQRPPLGAARDGALPVNSTPRLAQTAYFQGGTIGPSSTICDSSVTTPPVERYHTSLHSLRLYDGQEDTAGYPVPQCDPPVDGFSSYGSFPDVQAVWLPPNETYAQASANASGSGVQPIPPLSPANNPYESYSFSSIPSML